MAFESCRDRQILWQITGIIDRIRFLARTKLCKTTVDSNSKTGIAPAPILPLPAL